MKFRCGSNKKEKAELLIAKTISWRIVATIPLLIVTFLLTHNLKALLAVAGFDTIVRSILYMGHEVLWMKITKPSKKENAMEFVESTKKAA